MKQNQNIVVNDNPILSIIKEISEIYTIGISGSQSNGESDLLSDIDYAVVCKDVIPKKSQRKRIYDNTDAIKIKYLDVDFEVSRGDGLELNGFHFDILWMTQTRTLDFLAKLVTNFDCDEFLPGGLSKLHPLPGFQRNHDVLLRKIRYPITRSKGRVQSFLRKAHFNMYTLKWLEKADLRNDFYSFDKYVYECIDDIVAILYALNARWYSEEKRLMTIISSFQTIPRLVSSRIEDIIMRRDENQTMSGCIANLKGILAELSVMARDKFGTIDIPIAWE